MMDDSTARLDPRTLDTLNLEQALKDFEVANARVLDLTQRLVDSERKRKELSDELVRLKLHAWLPEGGRTEQRIMHLAGLARRMVLGLGQLASRARQMAARRGA
jgi:hypothetical protein